ncbi:hypothetical protein FAZ95_00890 [Trinickia violacea]|uniref:Putative integrase N-terminal domain-containing protein n=1 Tax=Trinickia violacea TaxID=2571746 RepID=A0A4P8IM44_9BURK|nr:site-specific integrase [Trinickia violacea]QCP47864.1 hypothetical protein FAZ95_00890 [Trinickia violacea]
MAKYEREIDDRKAGASKYGGDKVASEAKGWRDRVQEIITANVHKRVNGRVASNRTMEHNATVIFSAMNTLHRLGYPVKNPYNLGDKHVRTLVQHWYEEDKAASTMRNELSVLRKFFGWLDKPNVVKSLEEYLPGASPGRLTVSSSAKVTKSWSANGINVEEKLQQAFEIDDRFGMMIGAQLAFGLRRKEVICVRPWVSDQRDLGKDVFILFTRDGTKGGKQRLIPIEFQFQVQILDYIKERVGKRDAIGWKKTIRGENADLEKNVKRYNYYMSKLGITKASCSVCGHGLRAEYAENCALLEGFTPATLGGIGDEMTPDELKIAKIRVSERLGHSRPQITNSYFGSAKTNAKKAAAAAKVEGAAEPVPLLLTHAKADVPAGNEPNETPGITEPVTEEVGMAELRANIAPHGLAFFNGYYQNAPKGRKHPDDLDTIPAKTKAAADKGTSDCVDGA